MILTGLALAAVVEVGLERVAAQHGAPLRGRRVGLIAHAASVTADGRHAIDVLRSEGVVLVRLFAPEHGLRGAAAAGERQASGVDASSGLPVVSLYGDKTAPAAGDLAGLDALVVDLQDVGVRFYTYASTLLLAMDAAQRAGIEVVVLERPNPLGGEVVDGPETEARWRGRLTSLAPGPLIHGLTLGELARFANARRAQPARLSVVAMQGWRRGMLWDDTGRPWVPPSPNLRSSAAALAYPGICLLEATTLSEGRGTETPFLIFGAPWLRSDALQRALGVSGYAFTPERFTPRAQPAAPDPKYRDQDCAGLRVRITDARQARPYALGLQLLSTARRLHPELRWRDAELDGLLGTDRVRRALERGDSVDTILAADAPALAAFRRAREAILLY